MLLMLCLIAPTIEWRLVEGPKLCMTQCQVQIGS